MLSEAFSTASSDSFAFVICAQRECVRKTVPQAHLVFFGKCQSGYVVQDMEPVNMYALLIVQGLALPLIMHRGADSSPTTLNPFPNVLSCLLNFTVLTLCWKTPQTLQPQLI